MATLSDVSLARMANRGERPASEELVRRASGVVGDLLRRMGAGDALADDVTQDAMVAALRSLGGYRGEASFATWSMKIAARIYLRRRAKEARFVLMAEPLEQAGPSAESVNIARLDLDRALAQLSDPERLCVSMCHGAGLTQEEIARSLSLPLGTVKSHVTRGLRKLRILMIAEPAGSDADG